MVSKTFRQQALEEKQLQHKREMAAAKYAIAQDEAKLRNFERQDDLYILCHDGKYRVCPPLLQDELKRAFKGGKDYSYAKGPTGCTRRFANGVVVQYLTPGDEPKGPFVHNRELDLDRCIILRGPDRGKEREPPVVKGPIASQKAPPKNKVQVYDSTIREIPFEHSGWIIDWPRFNAKEAKFVIKSLLYVADIPIYFRIKLVRDGEWMIYPNGRVDDWGEKRDREAPLMRHNKAARRLTGSKYQWEVLKPSMVVCYPDTSISAIHSSFTSWARRRGIKWKIHTRDLGDGVIECYRPVGSYDG